ncbi:uncharacterized protein LOC135686979 isoform X2 [Rhopilema esculentum]
MWYAYPKDSRTWTCKLAGVLCFVKDFTVKSHFLRMLIIKNARQEAVVVWEQEVYKQFQYSPISEWFHTFEGDHCNIGLNFCDTEEASYFCKAVRQRIAFFRGRRAAIKARKEKQKQALIGAPGASEVISNVKATHNVKRIRPNLEERNHGKIAETDLGSINPSQAVGKVKEEDRSNIVLIRFESDEDSKQESKDTHRAGQFNQGPASKYSTLAKDNNNVGTKPPDQGHYENSQLIDTKSYVTSSTPRRLQFQRDENKTALKIAERQREYHSSMIRLLVSSRDPKVQQAEFLKLTNGGNNSKHSTKNIDFSASKHNTAEEDSGLSHKDHCPRLAPATSIINGPSNICVTKSKTTTDTSNNIFLGLRPNNDSEVSGPSRTSVKSFATESQLRKTASTLSTVPVKSSNVFSKSRKNIFSDDSSFSFPSLPSLDKLQFTASVQLTARSDDADSRDHLSTTYSVGIGANLETDNDAAGEERSALSQGKGPSNVINASGKRNSEGNNNVTDPRAELLKSIIAGKKLRKVNTDTVSVRRQTVFEKHFEEMADTLTKVLTERGRVFQDSSDEEDVYDDEEWEDDETDN